MAELRASDKLNAAIHSGSKSQWTNGLVNEMASWSVRKLFERIVTRDGLAGRNRRALLFLSATTSHTNITKHLRESEASCKDSPKTLLHLNHEWMPREVTAVSERGCAQALTRGLRGLLLSTRSARQFHQAHPNLDAEIRLTAHFLFLGGESGAQVLFGRGLRSTTGFHNSGEQVVPDAVHRRHRR
jgi:hypothetical protein